MRENADGSGNRLLVGVDTGGTFTDIVFVDGAHSGSLKLLSTPDDPARAVLEGLSRLFADRAPDTLSYGTTVATNAMLERRGAPTAFVTTAGFEDVLEIGRQNRPHLYDLEPRRVEPLVDRHRRYGVRERVRHDGTVERPVDRRALDRLAARLRRSGVRSIAVCLLHAHVYGDHERVVRDALAPLGLPISVSHEIAPAAGEFERASTTVANAYVRPVLARHLEALARGSRARRFRVLQSNGGAADVETAAREPVRTMLSGPAGGVAAAFRRARDADVARVVTLDMGGTSTDVALLDASVPRRPETSIGGLPVLTPSIDISTVGAGGGSIAVIDEGGALNVGPASAGADPGPACYGRGTQATVTDANLVLGRLRADAFLGGTMRLDVERARRALATLARAMGAPAAEHAAEGVIRVVEATMERAIRLITVERGQDPRTCALVVFGGAAGLHACGLADALGIPSILVPADPGLLSAWGVLDSPVVRDAAVAFRRSDPIYDELAAVARGAIDAARREVEHRAGPSDAVTTEVWVRLRYLGQAIELEVPLSRRFRRAFDREHRRLFSTADERRSIEVTGLRATASAEPRRNTKRARAVATAARDSRRASTVAPLPRGSRRPLARANRAAAQRTAAVWVGGRFRRVSLVDRDALSDGRGLVGPALVTEYSSTLWVAPGWAARADANASLRLERTRRSRG